MKLAQFYIAKTTIACYNITMQNVEKLKSVLHGMNVDVTSEQLEKLSAYFDMVVEKNKQFNLTAITLEVLQFMLLFAGTLQILLINLF